MVSICSKKEAVIAKPHLFLLKRGAAAVCPKPPFMRVLAGTDGGGSAVEPPHIRPLPKRGQ